MFPENRDKKFKLGLKVFNFPCTGNYITSCTLVIKTLEFVMK